MASVGPMARLLEAEPQAPSLNRLLESETFDAEDAPTVIEAGPAVVHFGGFVVGQKHTVTVKLQNVSTEARRLHVIDPQTPFFKCFVKKRDGGLYPGFADEVSIEFTPTEWRYYYDCIRVHVQGGKNLLIPMHGYPVPGNVSVPNRINFGHTAIGESVTRSIPLESNVPIAFDFSVLVTEPHQAFTITPSRGTVPANGATNLEVVYTPQSYSTSTCKFEFLLEQFNASPVTCECLGSCRPGMATEKIVKEAKRASKAKVQGVASPKVPTSPPKRATSQRPASHAKKTTPRAPLVGAPTELQGMRLPKNMGGHAAVNYILNQPAKSAAGAAVPLVEALEGRLSRADRAERERRFRDELAKSKTHSHASGEKLVSEEQCARVAADRDAAMTAYRDTLMLTPESRSSLTAATSTTVDSVLYRTVRHLDPHAGEKESSPLAHIPDPARLFEPVPSDSLHHRARVLNRFIKAARTIVIQNRGWHRIRLMRSVLERAADGTLKRPRLSQPTGPQENTHVLRALGAMAAPRSPEMERSALLSVRPEQVIGARFPPPKAPSVFGETRDRREMPETATPPVAVAAPSFWRLDVPWEFQLAGYAPYEPAPFVSSANEQELLKLPSLSIINRVRKPEPTGLPSFSMPKNVLGEDPLAGLTASCSTLTATEHLPFAENSVERFFNPLRYFPLGTKMLDTMPGPQVLDMSARTSMTTVKVQAHAAPINSPALNWLLPSEVPELAEPFEDMLPARPDEEEEEDDEDTEDAEEEAARAATVFQNALKTLAKDLKLDIWGGADADGDEVDTADTPSGSDAAAAE